MSLDNVEVVDAVGIETSTGTVVLSILDSLEWDDELGHLFALQAKLNAYFAFVESGQIYESYPDAKFSKLRIDVIGRYALPVTAVNLIDKAADLAAALNIKIAARILPTS